MNTNTNNPQAPAKPVDVQPVNVIVEDQNRTVTFQQKPDRFALHPSVVVMRWAEVKALAAKIIEYEAATELAVYGIGVNTQVVPQKAPGPVKGT
jgi:hypothetical protein